MERNLGRGGGTGSRDRPRWGILWMRQTPGTVSPVQGRSRGKYLKETIPLMSVACVAVFVVKLSSSTTDVFLVMSCRARRAWAGGGGWDGGRGWGCEDQRGNYFLSSHQFEPGTPIGIFLPAVLGCFLKNIFFYFTANVCGLGMDEPGSAGFSWLVLRNPQSSGLETVS